MAPTFYITINIYGDNATLHNIMNEIVYIVFGVGNSQNEGVKNLVQKWSFGTFQYHIDGDHLNITYTYSNDFRHGIHIEQIAQRYPTITFEEIGSGDEEWYAEYNIGG